MNLFARFKKDYYNYLISIIVPALVSGLSIPVFKRLLGAEGYGHFSIWLNSILIITALLSGWIMQGILRFYSLSSNKQLFSRHALLISIITQAIFFIPSVLCFFYLSNDIVLALLCSVSLVTCSLQFTVLPIVQSGFDSKKIIKSEMIRVLSYVLIATILLLFAKGNYLYFLFTAIIISYAFSVIYLLKNAMLPLAGENKNVYDKEEMKKLAMQFFKYAGPLILWFVLAYLLSYIDKLFMFKKIGAEVQGNYQAIFDLLSRSITILLTPIITSMFPILAANYEKGNRNEIRGLIKKIILLEFAGFGIVSVLYWWFGADLMIVILKTPDTLTYKWMGFITIAGTFIWQIGIVIQKRYELQLKNLFLLGMVSLAFAGQLVFYFVFQKYVEPLLYPLGFLLSAILYVLFISLPEIKTKFSFLLKNGIIFLDKNKRNPK